MSKRSKTPITVDAQPLETLMDVSLRQGSPPRNYELKPKHDGDKRAFLSNFMLRPLPSDLSERRFGNVDHLFDVQENASLACQTLHTICRDLAGC